MLQLAILYTVAIYLLNYIQKSNYQVKKYSISLSLTYVFYSLPESIRPKELDKEASLSIVAASKKKYAFQSFAIPPTPVVSKFPTDVKFSKIHNQKSPFEEYKHTAAELLCELGETLQIYAENNIAFPVGIVNLVNYSWLDLIEGTYKYATKKSLLKKQDVLQSNYNSMMVDKISNYPRIESHKENYLMKAKKDHHHFVPINPMEKTCKQKLLVRFINKKKRIKVASEIVIEHYVWLYYSDNLVCVNHFNNS